jgi:hypothetical protein
MSPCNLKADVCQGEKNVRVQFCVFFDVNGAVACFEWLLEN